MSKQKKPAQKPETLPDLLKVGEMFVKETYLRLHRQKHGMTTEAAENKLKAELRTGSVILYQRRGEIQIYRKQ